MSSKHVWNLGRWRLAFRFGRYRTGFKRYQTPGGHFSGALPFIWFSAIRRNRRSPVEEETTT